MIKEEMQALLAELSPLAFKGTQAERARVSILTCMLEFFISTGKNQIDYPTLQNAFSQTRLDNTRLEEMVIILLRDKVIKSVDGNPSPLILTSTYSFSNNIAECSKCSCELKLHEKHEPICTNCSKLYATNDKTDHYSFLMECKKHIQHELETNKISDLQYLLLTYLLGKREQGLEEFIPLHTLIKMVEEVTPDTPADSIRFALKELVNRWGIEFHITEEKKIMYRFLASYNCCDMCGDVLLPTDYFMCQECEMVHFDTIIETIREMQGTACESSSKSFLHKEVFNSIQRDTIENKIGNVKCADFTLIEPL